MPAIQVLPQEVASRIAAGEVIERPASMLKELLENSIDAGATRIDIESWQAGKKMLRVSDNGCGMDARDCELCLGRHATSKIRAFSDLSELRSFGFRGEALFAIASVSRLTLLSRPPESAEGWKVECEAGHVLRSAPAGAAPGTTIEVRDLFFNTPARLKFLKSDPLEKSRLSQAVEEAALAHPELSLSYKSEGRQQLRFDRAGGGDPMDNLRSRASAVLGQELSQGLLPVVAQRPGLSMRMLLSPIGALSASRNLQYWFVNRRPIESRLLQQALYRAYDAYRSKDRHPVCVAQIELPPDAFDVNVHPGKREIRFRSDRDMFEIVSGLVSSALYKNHSPQPLDVESRPLAASYPRSPAAVSYSLTPESTAPSLVLETAPSQALVPPSGSPVWFTPPFRFLGQIESSYLVFEAAGGIFVLDQHAAAERILFERVLSEIEEGGARAQRLMLPMVFELPASAAQKVLSRAARLNRLGFEIEASGRTGIAVLAAPALFGDDAAQLKELVHRLIDCVSDPAGPVADVRHDAIAMIACKAAVKAHDPLGEREALRLLEELKDCRDGGSCPHGRRAILALGRDELARRFQRPGAP
ncbi:MAG: DNA mismatch repair endonuclease MutL [Elusimicrobia bacterium]|nr:DNA mismatch repair endonuclease MutL [Elusimicrobiota bacterium]